MNDTQLRGWIRVLPRAKASPAFTSDVLRKARLAAPEERHVPFVWRMAAAFAMAVCILGVVQIAVIQYTHKQRTHKQQLNALRLEQEKIEAELAAVKKIANEAEPMVVLEDGKGTRVIMDLDSAIQPASLKTYD